MRAAKPITLGRAWDLLDSCRQDLASAYPALQSLTPAGDIRRVEPLVSSIVLVACVADPEDAMRSFSSPSSSTRLLSNTEVLASRHLAGTYRTATVEVIVATPDDHGSILFASTGSDRHVEEMRARLAAGRQHATETDLYASADLPLIVPELRHGSDEIAAAEADRLPQLVEQAHMRGDLHMHTTYSDGRDTLEAMVAGGHALGYEYIAITDHSEGAAAARTLGRDEIAHQRDAINRLREKFPDMTILHGIEVDILADGRLDFEDSLLEQFDLVLASLHDDDGQDGEQLTERSLAAIRHPLVNVLCHPANQLVGQFEGYELDFDALYAAAAETGTALEVDGAPSHMDLDGWRARAAVAAGVTLSVDSDCHRVEALGRQMGFGVGTARRGWVEAGHVLNTRPLADVREFITAKRRGRR